MWYDQLSWNGGWRLEAGAVVYTQVASFGADFQQLWHEICAVILTEFNLPELHEGANHVRRNCCGT